MDSTSVQGQDRINRSVWRGRMSSVPVKPRNTPHSVGLMDRLGFHKPS